MMYDNMMKLAVTAQSVNEAFARSTVSAFVSQLDPTIEQLEDIRTAVSEAVTNSVVHGYNSSGEGTIEIVCRISGKNAEIEITDFGKGISDIHQAMQPFYTTVTSGERAGMGFAVMQAFCDKVEVSSSQGRTSVRLTKSNLGD